MKISILMIAATMTLQAAGLARAEFVLNERPAVRAILERSEEAAGRMKDARASLAVPLHLTRMGSFWHDDCQTITLVAGQELTGDRTFASIEYVIYCDDLAADIANCPRYPEKVEIRQVRLERPRSSAEKAVSIRVCQRAGSLRARAEGYSFSVATGPASQVDSATRTASAVITARRRPL